MYSSKIFQIPQSLVWVLFMIFPGVWGGSSLWPLDDEDPHFYPYGQDAGDVFMEPEDDGSSGNVSLSIPFGFFGNYYSWLWVSGFFNG